MRFIAHRGNYNGPSEHENTSEYIKHALYDMKLDVEVDIRIDDKGRFRLGHNEIGDFVGDWGRLVRYNPYLDKIWWHCKDIETFRAALDSKLMHCFFHDQDDCTLTSRGYIWVYPGKTIVQDCIMVVQETILHTKEELQKCYAVCADNINLLTYITGANNDKCIRPN